MRTIKVPMRVVDAQTGEVKEEKTSDWHIMPTDTSEGQCPECGVKHDPADPHNAQSLAYQYDFYAKHERWPTWGDAMAHCTPETQRMWIAALEAKGVPVESLAPSK